MDDLVPEGSKIVDCRFTGGELGRGEAIFRIPAAFRGPMYRQTGTATITIGAGGRIDVGGSFMLGTGCVIRSREPRHPRLRMFRLLARKLCGHQPGFVIEIPPCLDDEAGELLAGR